MQQGEVKFTNILGRVVHTGDCTTQFIPNMLYEVAVWRSWRLLHRGDVALLKETKNYPSTVRCGVIVLVGWSRIFLLVKYPWLKKYIRRRSCVSSYTNHPLCDCSDTEYYCWFIYAEHTLVCIGAGTWITMIKYMKLCERHGCKVKQVYYDIFIPHYATYAHW